MSNLIAGNALVAGDVVNPTDRTQSNPSMSFGGDPINNSGTGIYGDYTSVSVTVSGANALTANANGLRLGATTSDVYLFSGAGAPTNNVTGLNFAGKGALYIDTTNGVLYINTAAKATPTWVTVGSQT